ncbi:uncharacterized protein LOC126811409 [Patella vulgata]|uniref:uncharacterized protein LOC126811409 n=1 Tax=Patella vulgata TaxID=6465 RepID=UPI0024A90E43|nr:uncharacterized protein LOC126811409 [Patella vulgata]XP_050392960.2 uncharacterized protein LOC126811409 [Patella vulgata]XP_055954527.1 uncharacterized protein LOC126811409 [Patella vulgata]
METLLAVLFLFLGTASAHICLISPQQRGQIDISTSGSRTCFKHGFPCGGDSPAAPQFILEAGQPAFIKWQQNYNHYEVGFPGYMDISYGPVNSTQESQWTVLAVVSDKYVFSQDYQENYTAIVTIPNTPCDHCVLRVRYNAHKAGEDTFYQCSDVHVSSNTGHASPLKFPLTDSKDKALQGAVQLTHRKNNPKNVKGAESFYGEAYDPFNPSRITYVQIDPTTGEKTSIKRMDFGLDGGNSQAGDTKYIADTVVGVDPVGKSTVFMFHGAGSLDVIPKQLLEIGLSNGSVLNTQHIPALDGTMAINGLAYMYPEHYLTFSLQEESTKPGNFYFVVGILDHTGGWKMLAKTPTTENLYVNYQSIVYNRGKHLLHILMGNENAADALNARIYTFNVSPSTERFQGFRELDVSSFTFMSIDVYEKTGQVLAISPGLFTDTYPSYSLVEINPITGNVTQIMKVTPPGIFEKYYGGSVVNGLDQLNGQLKHVFRVADSEADVIASINIDSQTVTFSQITNLRHIHNIVHVPATP